MTETQNDVTEILKRIYPWSENEDLENGLNEAAEVFEDSEQKKKIRLANVEGDKNCFPV